jgi:hypothetical protein
MQEKVATQDMRIQDSGHGKPAARHFLDNGDMLRHAQPKPAALTRNDRPEKT